MQGPTLVLYKTKKKTFQKDVGMTMPNKAYIGMAVCKGIYLHVTATAALIITHIWLLSSVWPIQNIACSGRDLVSYTNLF